MVDARAVVARDPAHALDLAQQRALGREEELRSSVRRLADHLEGWRDGGGEESNITISSRSAGTAGSVASGEGR